VFDKQQVLGGAVPPIAQPLAEWNRVALGYRQQTGSC
jgi:hypothetical protein